MLQEKIHAKAREKVFNMLSKIEKSIMEQIGSIPGYNPNSSNYSHRIECSNLAKEIASVSYWDGLEEQNYPLITELISRAESEIEGQLIESSQFNKQ